MHINGSNKAFYDYYYFTDQRKNESTAKRFLLLSRRGSSSQQKKEGKSSSSISSNVYRQAGAVREGDRSVGSVEVGGDVGGKGQVREGILDSLAVIASSSGLSRKKLLDLSQH